MRKTRNNKYYKEISRFLEKCETRNLLLEYEYIFKVIVKNNFKIKSSEIDNMFKNMCVGNWSKLWETETDKEKSVDELIEELRFEIKYCSDKYTWDRLLRTHWLYQIIKRRIDDMHGTT